MKIGFVSAQFPSDLRTSVYGGFQRMGMFIEALRTLGELDALFYVRPETALDAGHVKEWEERLSRHYDARLTLDLCRLSPVVPPKGRWQEYVRPAFSIASLVPFLQTAQGEQVAAARRLLSRKPDILFVHRLISMVPILRSGTPLPPTYYDLDDVEHVTFARSIRQPPWWTGKPLLYLRLPLLKRWESHAIRVSRAAFVCSEQDRGHVKRAFGHDNVVVIPNAIDLPEARAVPAGQTLLFLGLLSYHPNTVAADHLIRNIWPKVLSVLPQARLLIAGARPEWLASYEQRPKGVTFVGFVEDLDKLYDEVAVVCCPMLYGSGTRIKILEAAAYGRPVVSTTLGAEGLRLKDGEEILVRDDPGSFAEACVRLLTDRRMAASMGRKARLVVEQEYERRVVVEKIRKLVARAPASIRGPDALCR
jgi:glycosyltransferase involved in cell wall biosynthesis